MPETITCSFTADVVQISTNGGAEKVADPGLVRETKFRSSGRLRKVKDFLTRPLSKRSTFGLRETEDRFGPFSDPPGTDPRDDPIRPAGSDGMDDDE